LGNLLFDFAFRAKSENEKYSKQISSASGLAIFIADSADKQHWVDVGRSAERFLLQATAHGMRVAFVNQPVEVPTVRLQMASYLGLGNRRPDLIIRF
jgi:hypothetical protein